MNMLKESAKVKNYQRVVAMLCLFGCLMTVTVRIGMGTQIIGSSNTKEHIMTSSDTATRDDDDTKLPSVLPFDGMPRAVIAHPCSGSSVTMKITEKILKAHGYNVFHGGQPLLHNDKDIMDKATQRLEARVDREPTRKESISEMFVYLNEQASKHQKMLLFKIESYRLVLDTLKELGTKIIYTYRGNYLDRAICTVRDCFKEDMGDLVYVNGTKADVCFHRRKSDEKLMAYFNDTELLMNRMEFWKEEDAGIIQEYPVDSAAYEDLFKFEYTDSYKVFNDSVKLWCAFLKSFGEIKESIVKEVLQPDKNSRPPRPRLEEMIYNFDEIKDSVDEYLSE